MIPNQLNTTGSAGDESTASMMDEGKTMPLGVGEFAEESPTLDPLAGSSASRKFSAGSLVIVLVIVVAVGGLWGMRKLTAVKASSGANTEVEKTIEKFLSVVTGQAKSGADAAKTHVPDTGVLDVLKETYTERQVALTDVQRNPFIIYGETIVNTMPGEAPDASSAAARQRTDRQSEFERGASSLHLKSVIMGSDPLANISGKIVRVGEEIIGGNGAVAYRVTKITSDAVTLVAEDKPLNLTVEVVLTIKRFN